LPAEEKRIVRIIKEFDFQLDRGQAAEPLPESATIFAAGDALPIFRMGASAGLRPVAVSPYRRPPHFQHVVRI
jgi:hypothetical protein